MRTNTFTWIALLLLTLTSFLARDPGAVRGAAGFILAMAGIKCAALGWNFMALRAAHRFWPGVLLAMVAAVLVAGGALAGTL